MLGRESGTWKFAAGAFYGPATSPADVDSGLAFLNSQPVSSLALIYSTHEFDITPFDWDGVSKLPAGLQLLALMRAEDLDGFIGMCVCLCVPDLFLPQFVVFAFGASIVCISLWQFHICCLSCMYMYACPSLCWSVCPS